MRLLSRYNGVGASLVSALILGLAIVNPASAEGIRYGSTHSTLGTSGDISVENDICMMSQRTPYDMGVVKMQDVHPQYANWNVSDEAYWAVVSAVDCWTTDSVTGIPVDLTGHTISIHGSYQVATAEGIRVFATVKWEDPASDFEEFKVWSFLLVEGGEPYTIEDFSQAEPVNTLRTLAQEGWEVTELRDFAQAVMPQANTLAGLTLIDNEQLVLGLEAIYAADLLAVDGESVTDVIYTDSDSSLQAIVKVDGPSGEWILAVNLGDNLSFTYLSEETEATTVADNLNIPLPEAAQLISVAL